MIRITYYRKKHRVTIEGHAESAEKGHDLVCSAVSVLAYTLAAFVTNMDASGQLKSKSVKLGEGDSRICCKTATKNDAGVTLVFDSICGGFELLRENFPQFVNYEILSA